MNKTINKTMSEEQKPLYIASCSFGKDSVATILLALENNEPLDRVVFVEVMFDHERGISGEDPTHIEWVYRVAIPKLEKMGVKVDVEKSHRDYVGLFTRKKTRPRDLTKIGKLQGWLIQKKCALNCEGKKRRLDKYHRNFKRPIVQYVGIAIDEPKRLARLGSNKISLLAKYGYTEGDAWRKCEEYGLLSPFYGLGYKRNGCWFCPNKPVKYFCHIRSNYPPYGRSCANSLPYPTRYPRTSTNAIHLRSWRREWTWKIRRSLSTKNTNNKHYSDLWN